MKKLIPLLVLVVAVTCSLNAQSPQIIFKNGGTTSYSLPFGSNASQKFQCFYPALSFPAAQGSITRLYFRSSAAITGSVTYTNFIIKLGQTTSTNYPGAGNADFFTGLTTVYSAASYTLVGATTDYQWFYIDLQIPFAYVQTSSNALVLEMQYSAKTGTGTQNIFGTATSPGTLSSTNVSATSGTINTNRINLGFDFQCSGTPLSGTYTINDLSPLSSTNFQSFSGFVEALRCNGISAPVVANVTTINTQLYEHVQMSAITGASSVNTITINGNNKTLTSLNGTVIYTLSLNGADYTIWNNLTIEASHPTNGFALLMHNQSDNNSFNNCTFKATQASTSSQSAAVIFSNSEVLAIAYGNNGNNNVFTSCTMIGGNYGVSFLGQSGGLISNNQLINSTIKEFLSNGVTSVYTTGTVIRSCIIERPTRTVFNGTTHYGIFSTTLTNSIIIEKNRIRNMYGAATNSTNTLHGIYLASNGSSGNESKLINNIISDNNHEGILYGMSLHGSYLQVFHNTISLDYTSSATSNSTYGMENFSSNSTFKNNIISINRGGSGLKYGLYFNNAAPQPVCNNNNIYVAGAGGNNYTGYFSSANYATLANWQAANGGIWDAQSLSANPTFANPSTGDFTPTNSVINNIGTNVGVTTDIVNATRSAISPDAGAYEFGLAPLDLSVTALVSPFASINCHTSTETVIATIKNFGPSTINFSTNPATITCKVAGASTATITFTPTGTLAAGASTNITFSSSLNLSATGTHNLRLYSSMTGDANLNNDSLASVAIVSSALTAGTISTPSTSYCTTSFPVLTLSGNTSGSAIQWQVSTTSNTGPWTNVGTNSSTYTPTVAATSYFKAVVSCGANTANSNVVTISISALAPGYISSNSELFCTAGLLNLTLISYSIGAAIQWQSSTTSTTGPWTNIGTNSPTYSTTITTTTYYRAVLTCGANTSNTNNTVTVTVNNTAPANFYASAIGTNTASFSWSNVTGATSYNYRYRVVGAATWTTGSVVNTNVTISGLTIATQYEWQLQTVCSAGGNSPFSVSKIFNTAPDCSLAQVISSGPFYTFNPVTSQGAWSSSYCSGTSYSGMETVYSFTPTVSGTHVLFVQPLVSNTNSAGFFYKAATAGCDGSNWNCIGNIYQSIGNVSQLMFGPLTAGTQYYIMGKVFTQTVAPVPVTFRIEAPNCLPIPTNVSAISSTHTSINLIWAGSSPNGTIVEYGLQGFIPGTGYSPGTGGSTVLLSGTSGVITGLANGTMYDIYVRSYCGSGLCSPNSNKFVTYTQACPFYIPISVGSLNTAGSIQVGLYNYQDYSCFPNPSPGRENYYSFTPPSSGYYTVATGVTGQNINLLSRVASASCDVTSYSCMTPVSVTNTIYTYNWGPLTAGITYNLLMDLSDTSFWSANNIIGFVISCPAPSNIVANNFQPTSANITWSCNCATTYLEYGPTGFTPGTGATAGTNGTVIANVTSPYTLNGLTPNSAYDVYLRSSCGGNFSGNTTVVKFKTAIDCGSATAISCGDFFSYDMVTGSTQGSWQIGTCGNSYNTSLEKLYKFTPSTSGNYSMLMYGSDVVPNSIFSANFYYKTAVGSCIDTGWVCLGTMQSNGNLFNSFPPTTFTLPSLTAGVTYLILIDGTTHSTKSYHLYGRLDCPNFCSSPRLNTYGNTITQSSYTILSYCNTCFGNLILEYGPAGFTPGTGATPGTNGTVVAVSTFPYTINGLNSGVTYDVYARTNCGAGSYSANSAKISFTTLACATASITGTPAFCAGSANILTANTGTGITYQWYRNNILQPGATTNTFNANSNGTYYVVETSSCGTATSNSIVVTQINNPNATVSYSTPLSFCTPGNVVLTSSTFSGINYQWQKNSVDIAGATLQNYTATSNGSYKVKQTANGCYKTSAAVTTTTATSVSAAITANGPVTFCTGGSVVLSVSNAVPGYGYQWKNNGVNIGNATTSSYTATAAGSYTCTVTASCGTAASNAIVVSTGGITASVTPSGTVTICTGATALLSANTGTGYNYQWKLNNINITNATSSTYSATASGNYTVAITSPCGNATSAATTVNIANVTASITPAGNVSVCAGSASNYTANSGFNYTYQWKRNGVAVAGATNQTYSNNSAGSYTVVVTQGGVCSATSSATVLTVINNPTPTITAQGPTTFCAGQSVVLAANTYAGVSYQWQKNSIDIANGTNQNYTATTQGTYRVKQTANGCLKTSGTIAVTVNCRVAAEGFGEEHAGHSDIKVIPNPFTDEFQVSGLTFKAGDKLQMINVLGAMVLNEAVRNSTPNLILQTRNLKPGVYFLQVVTATERKTVKVVRE